jgi:hypothetical protein
MLPIRLNPAKSILVVCVVFATFDQLAVCAEFAAYETLAAESAKPGAKSPAKKKEEFKKAVNGAYKPLFYDNSFDYIDSPLYDQWFPGDAFKRRRPSDCVVYDIGGQFRLRSQHEQNMRGLGLTGLDDDMLLQRLRLFGNVQVGEGLRGYVEFLDAVSHGEDLPPRIIEEDRAEILNLFGDVKMLDAEDGELYARLGRQELLYGSERLISPLDWANTRRTFEGYKLFWKGKDWNVDAFYTKPVLIDADAYNQPGKNQEFSGVWGTYKGTKNRTVDLYYLTFWNSLNTTDFQFQTVGGRYTGNEGEFLWDFEGGVQYGQNTDNSDHSAGFWVAGLGHKRDDLPWKPALWAYYDWASGSNNLGAGNGFNHLFPLAHKYLGFMDLYGRSNIETPNVQLTLQPAEKWKLLVWYYYFFLQTRDDTPYNVNMTPFNPANRPASRDLGHELDFLLYYTICPRMDMLFGYSHFFSGEYYRETTGAPHQADADFFYVQWQWNF